MKWLKKFENLNDDYFIRIGNNEHSELSSKQSQFCFSKEEVKKVESYLKTVVDKWQWEHVVIGYEFDGFYLTDDYSLTISIDQPYINITDHYGKVHEIKPKDAIDPITFEYYTLIILGHIYINKIEDEWYISDEGSRYGQYKCDQFEGLIKYIDNINKKYIKEK